MKIRKFRKSDARKVSYVMKRANYDVLCRCYSKKILDLFYRKNIPSEIIRKSKTREIFVAAEGDKILGTAGLKGSEIKNVFVNPKIHRKGIGTKLVNYVENIAKKRKIKKVWLTASLLAENFYKKLGYKRIRRETHRIEGVGVDVIRMEKRI